MNPNVMLPVASLARARRNCAVGTAVAVALTASLLAVAALASFDVAAPFPRAFRMALAVAGTAALFAWIARRLRLAWLRHSDKSAALAMEAAHPEFGQQFRTALDVAERGVPEDAAPEAKFFTSRLIAQTEDSLGRFSWSGLVPRGRLAAWIAAGLAVVVGIALAANRSPDFRLALERIISPATAGTYTKLAWTVAPRVFDERHPPRFELRVERRLAEPTLFLRESGGAWVKTSMTALPDGRSWDIVLTGRTNDFEMYAAAGDARTASLAVAFQPIAKLTAARVHLTYPEYTGLKPEDRNQGDVSVVEDTQVRWEFKFNIVPKNVEWRIGADAPRRLTVDPAAKTASVEWTAGASRGNASISVLDDSGEAIDSWRYVAEGFADALPTVQILEPAKDQEATSITELPIRIRAKDDFGVSEVGLVLEAGGHREWVLEKVIPERNQKDVTEIATAMLEKVPLTLRDNVRIYAYALDHKPRGGPRAVSPLLSIDIREFKKRWMFREARGGIPNRLQIIDALAKLGELISGQRIVVSDTFVLREKTRSAGTPVTAAALPIGEREAALAEKAGDLAEKWLDSGAISRDDATLLDTAHTQMEEAAASLGLEGSANLDKAFPTADRALSTLLQLRKVLLTILMNAPADGPSSKSGDQMKPLAELAKEAERLAGEERDVRGQLAPEVAAGTNLDATRHQHEVAVSDGGELYAEIVDHPQANDEVIRLMGDAEKALHVADETLHGPEPRTAAPLLETSEQRLLETAQFLRAMELTAAADTLKQLAATAEQDGKSTRDSAGGKGDAPNAPPKENGGEQKDPARKAARDTALADKILGALAEKAGGKDQVSDLETGNAEKTAGETLAELREETNPGRLAEELEKLADLQQKPGGDGLEAKGLAEAAAGKLDAMAREFRDAAQRLEASRAALLAMAQAMAKDLEKQLAAAGEKPGNKPGGKPGGKDGKKGDGKGDGQKGDGAGQKPGDKAGLAKGDKPGKDGSGAGKGDKPGEKPGGQGLAKGGQPGNAAPGDKPTDAKENGRGGIAGDIEIAHEGPGGQTMGRFSKALRGIGDDRLHDLAIKLFNAPFSRDSIPAVEDAAQRIDELVAALPAAPAPVTTTGRVPESRRREVEDYFRNLSDDFGGEKWDAPPPPGQKTE